MTTPKTLQELIAAEKASLVRDEDAQAKTWDKLEMSIAAGVLLPLDVLPLDVPADLPLDGSGLGDALANAGQAAAGGASATGAAAGGAASTTGAAGAATVGSSLLAGAASKVGIGLLVVGGGVGSWYVASTPNVTEAPVAQPVPIAAPIESTVTESPKEAHQPEPAAEAAAEQAEAAPSPGPSPSKPQPRMAKDTFDGELRQIRRAQGALAAGQNERALSIVEEHEKQAPRGQFSEDREALRALALCRAGDAKALRVAKGFLRRFPNSVYVEGVKAACLKGAESSAPSKQR